MSGVIVAIPTRTWVKLTTGSTVGSIRHKSGASTVVYVESAILPVGYDENTPVIEETRARETWPYFNVAAGEFIYAWADFGAELVIAEGVI
jgi:hypothetical protein